MSYTFPHDGTKEKGKKRIEEQLKRRILVYLYTCIIILPYKEIRG